MHTNYSESVIEVQNALHVSLVMSVDCKNLKAVLKTLSSCDQCSLLTKAGPLALRPVTASMCFSAISSQIPKVDPRLCTSSPSPGRVLLPRANTVAPACTRAGVLGIILITRLSAGSS